MGRLTLSPAARADISEIWRYGHERWGPESSEKYVSGLLECLTRISNAPEQFPRVDHIRKGYRRAVYRKHAIYFQSQNETALIMAIIGRQQLSSF